MTASSDWLSIKEASRLLGVHIGTVRDWADAGLLPSYRTPGGHRRFTAYDIDRFLRQAQSKSERRPLSEPAENAIGLVRQELQSHPLRSASWFQSLSITPSAQDRTRQREFGQELLTCVVHYAERPDGRDDLLDDGQRIAREYGRWLASKGLSAANAARATIHFRGLVLKTVLEAKIGSRRGDEEDARLFQRVSAFLDEILLSILDAYP